MDLGDSIGMRTNPLKTHVDWLGSIPFVTVHLVAIVGVFFFKISWPAILLCIGSYYFRMFTITAGYHRYFSHRSYKTSRAFQFILAALACTCTQKGVLWWAAHHRNHHRYSDTKGDLHSPVVYPVLWAHMTWILDAAYSDYNPDEIRDFAKYPELRFLDQYHLIPVVLFNLILFACGGLNAVFWGYFVSTVLLWHNTFFVNSLAHLWGTRRFETSDRSRNNFLIALLTMGEGWHNNHHHYMSSARQGYTWWEIDFSFYLLKLLSLFGIVWDLRTYPAHLELPKYPLSNASRWRSNVSPESAHIRSVASNT